MRTIELPWETWRAVVLEARDRIGGRCYSNNSFPAPLDFGGQFFQQVVPNVFGGMNRSSQRGTVNHG
jgi:monoamine oxidase